MNILFLSELFYPRKGGAELATYLYAKLLVEAGFDISVVTNKFAGESSFSKEGNMKVYRWPLFNNAYSKYSILGRVDVLASNFVRRMMKWANLIYVPRFWYSAILLAKAYKKPVITHLHDYIPVCPLSNLYEEHKGTFCSNSNNLLCPPRCIYVHERKTRSLAGSLISVVLNATVGHNLGKLIALSDAIICVSKAHKKLIIERAPHLSRNIHVIYNPLPELSYTKIHGDDFGYFGGPSCLKGFNILCDALVHTKNQRIRVHGTNFSNNTRLLFDSSGPEFLLYKRLDEIAFENMWKRIRAVVVPSVWHEPLPYVVTEAVLRGRIVLASNAGGIPEQVEGCKGALLCEIGNHKQFAEELNFVRGLSKENAAEFGLRNRETFLKRFNNKNTLREFIRLCENLH